MTDTKEPTLDNYPATHKGWAAVMNAIEATAAPASPRPWRLDYQGMNFGRRVYDLHDARGWVVAQKLWEEDARLILSCVSR